jgi:hypothetical protein
MVGRRKGYSHLSFTAAFARYLMRVRKKYLMVFLEQRLEVIESTLRFGGRRDKACVEKLRRARDLSIRYFDTHCELDHVMHDRRHVCFYIFYATGAAFSFITPTVDDLPWPCPPTPWPEAQK